MYYCFAVLGMQDVILPFPHVVFIDLRIEGNGPGGKVQPSNDNTKNKDFFIVYDSHTDICCDGTEI